MQFYAEIRSFMRIWSHLPKKSLMENFIFCAVCFITFLKNDSISSKQSGFRSVDFCISQLLSTDH